jgi:sortase A
MRPGRRLSLLAMSVLAAVSTAVVVGGVDRAAATPGPRPALFLPAPLVKAQIPDEDALAPDQVVFGRAAVPTVGVAQATVDESSPVARLTIPKLGLRDAPIFERGLDAKGQMRIASGYALTHYVHSAPLGSPGNAVLYGHNDIEGSIFRYLDRLQPGDQFSLVVEGRTLYYRIANRSIVTPDHLELLNPTPSGRLTVFTCYPYWVDTHRVVLIAEPD